MAGNVQSTPAEAPDQVPPRRPASPLRGLLALALTFLTMTWAGARFAGIDVFSDPGHLERGYPYAITLLFILLAHQIGPFLLGRRRGVVTSLPWLLAAPPPLLSTGIAGVFCRAEGAPRDRRALFDLAFAGSFLGGAAAVLALVLGLPLSAARPLAPDDPGGLMLGDSLLTNFLVRTVLDIDPSSFSIALHPIALAGWVGTMLCGLSLLPIGQLNGGHIAYAVGGAPLHRWLTRGTLTALLVLGIGGWHGWMAWIGFMLVIDVRHPPPRDVATGLDRTRLVLAALSAVLLALLFLAEPVYRQPPPIEIPTRGLRAV
jgi:membrane-associated protease RseP (regulator of RpoE activity)